MDITRYLEHFIKSDALKSHKIAFINGPRQVGKTSLAKSLLEEEKGPTSYFSYDDDEFRKIWIKDPKSLFENKTLVSLDEVHKDRKWKNKLKGIYDLYGDKTKMIVTGSARLDYFRKSGDSLQGRYIPYRLHPLSLNEKPTIPEPPKDEWEGDLKTQYDLKSLLELGGFPEPFFDGSANKAQRWRRLYRERMIREDLRDLKEIRDVEQLKTLALLLEEKVSSPLSYESLRQDLGVSFATVRDWIELLEAVYFSYRIKPYSKNIQASIRKEPKLYLSDWSSVENTGAKYENLIASHLLKSCHAWTDCAFGEYDLFYVRDKQKREVDFLVTENKKPYLLLEVKSGSSEVSPALRHFSEVLKPKFSIQVVFDLKKERRPSMNDPKIQVMDVRRFLSRLV